MTILLLALVLAVTFGLGAWLGAPYLPSHRAAIQAALDLASVRSGGVWLDLGCGSGSVLVAAAKRGLRVYGIEINPLLAGIAWLRLLPFRGRATVRIGNFWQMDWPEADVVFVFLIGRFMPKLDRELNSRIKRPTKVVSYAFKLPSLEPLAEASGCYLYQIDSSDLSASA